MITIPPVYIVTGTPGTGKTTISSLLSEKLNAHHIELSKFAIENNLIEADDDERNTKVVSLPALTERIAQRVDETDGPVILDGHFAHDIIIESKVTKAVILRSKPWLLKEELEKRGYSSEKVWENLEAEIVGVVTSEVSDLFPPGKIIELETSKKTPLETVELIISQLDQDTSYNQIDWITYPETLRLLMSRPCTL